MEVIVAFSRIKQKNIDLFHCVVIFLDNFIIKTINLEQIQLKNIENEERNGRKHKCGAENFTRIQIFALD